MNQLSAINRTINIINKSQSQSTRKSGIGERAVSQSPTESPLRVTCPKSSVVTCYLLGKPAGTVVEAQSESIFSWGFVFLGDEHGRHFHHLEQFGEFSSC